MTSKPLLKYGILIIGLILWYVLIWSNLNDMLAQNITEQEKLSLKL